MFKLFQPVANELLVEHVIIEYLAAKTELQQAGLLTTAALVKSHVYCLAFSDLFGAMPVSQCRHGDLRHFLAKHPEYKSPHTKHDACAQIVTCFRWAADDGMIAVCPYAKPRELPTPQPREPITREEVRAILGHARVGRGLTPIRFRMALWFLWETGIRTVELYRLDWTEYDAARGAFQQQGKTTYRTGKPRLIALPSRAWRLIRFLRRADTRVAGPVFLNGRGRPWNRHTFAHLFRLHADAVGVRGEITAYCCRHGFCCEALEGGAPERQLADYLGHSSTKLISYYGRAVKERVDYLREVADTRRK